VVDDGVVDTDRKMGYEEWIYPVRGGVTDR